MFAYSYDLHVDFTGSVRQLNYTLQTMTSGCYFYVEETEMWGMDGCEVLFTLCYIYFLTLWPWNVFLKVIEPTNVLQTTCACTHLTSFASGFFVPPNNIDFDHVFANIDFLSNPTLYVTEIIIVLAYIIAAILARRADRKDVHKVQAFFRLQCTRIPC